MFNLRKEKHAIVEELETTLKTAYSHGLENIYTLENVDIKSVRRLHDTNFSLNAPSSERVITKSYPTINKEEEFDFGVNYRKWIKPFLLQESIQVLELSKYVEKCLLDQSFLFVGQLIRVNWEGLTCFRGLTSTHLEEVKDKLQAYTKGKELHSTRSLDFKSWIRTLINRSSKSKKISLCLEEYALTDLIPLTLTEAFEIRRLTTESRLQWYTEGKKELIAQPVQAHLMTQIQMLSEALLRPWMTSRLGICNEDELVERVERLSVDAEITPLALKFLSAIYFKGNFPFACALYEVEKGIYCDYSWRLVAYKKVIDLALTYFYQSTTSYSLKNLTSLIAREFCQNWIGFAEGFIEKVLCYSLRFKLYCQQDFSLHLKLNSRF